MTRRRPDGLDPKSQAARWKRGRPAVLVSMSVDTLEKLDKLCAKRGESRGDVIAWLLDKKKALD